MIVCPVYGAFYEESFKELQNSLSEQIVKVTPQDLNIDHSCSRILGLLTKASCYKYKNLNVKKNEKIILIDADMVAQDHNVLDHLPIIDADLAAVPYSHSGKLFVPFPKVQAALDSGIPILNSGFMVFKNISVFKYIGQEWELEYLELIHQYYKQNNFINDEYALYIALHKTQHSIFQLPEIWNDFYKKLDICHFKHNVSDGRIR